MLAHPLPVRSFQAPFVTTTSACLRLYRQRRYTPYTGRSVRSAFCLFLCTSVFLKPQPSASPAPESFSPCRVPPRLRIMCRSHRHPTKSLCCPMQVHIRREVVAVHGPRLRGEQHEVNSHLVRGVLAAPRLLATLADHVVKRARQVEHGHVHRACSALARGPSQRDACLLVRR